MRPAEPKPASLRDRRRILLQPSVESSCSRRILLQPSLSHAARPRAPRRYSHPHPNVISSGACSSHAVPLGRTFSALAATPRTRHRRLLAWFLTVSKELTNTIAMLRAVWDRPVQEFTEIEHVNQSTYRFHAFSRSRRLWSLFVAAIRFTIALNMLICGMQFLAYTIELSRLLLQTVVLSFVMNVDELVFTTLAPLHAKQARTPHARRTSHGRLHRRSHLALCRSRHSSNPHP